MLLLIDLDDTIYLERDYVLSVYRSIASLLTPEHANEAYQYLEYEFFKYGRRGLLDRWRKIHQLPLELNELIDIYRSTTPTITLDPDTRTILEKLTAAHTTILVTDGSPIVQHKKIEALGLSSLFNSLFICQEHGLTKPDKSLLLKLLNQYGAIREECFVIGDDPYADINPAFEAAIQSIRIRYGRFESIANDHKPTYEYSNLTDITEVIDV
jgi:putative hydrolase of the HAD superfamily